MPRGDPMDAEDQYQLFLLDGLTTTHSPVFLLVQDEAVAARVALAMHAGTVSRPDLPAATAGLIRFSAEDVRGLDEATAERTVRELASARHWTYLPAVDELLDVAGGRQFLASLLHAVASGDLAALITSVHPERLARLHSDGVRLMGFAEVIDPGRKAEGLARSSVTSIVRQAIDRNDVGWTVVVRYDLRAPIASDAPFAADPEMGPAMELVEAMHLVDLPGRPPAGVLVSLIPDAFSMTQETAAFSTAATAARRLIGRPLAADESVTPTRALFYA